MRSSITKRLVHVQVLLSYQKRPINTSRLIDHQLPTLEKTMKKCLGKPRDDMELLEKNASF